MMMPSPLAVIGNVNVDLVMGPVACWPQPGSEVVVEAGEVRCGGAAGNVALAWTALDVDYQIAAHTGSDHFGAWLREQFAPHSDGGPIAEGATGVSVGLTHPDSERTFITSLGHLSGLDWPQTKRMIDWQRLEGGTLLVCGSFVLPGLSDGYPALFAEARTRGIRTALDTGAPPEGWSATCREQVLGWAGACDCLLLNESEVTQAAGIAAVPDAAAALVSRMPAGALVVVKLGPAGALACTAEGCVEVAAPAVTVVDTVGAGDVFNAGFLVGQSHGLSLRRSLECGVGLASTAVSTRPRRYQLPGQPRRPG